MSVESIHPSYEYASSDWSMLRAVIAGSREVKAAGPAYLPALDGQTDADYRAYVQRATFHAATARTVDGLTGAVFRKPATVTLPPRLRFLVDDSDGRGTPLGTFAQAVVREVISVGRVGLLADILDGEMPQPVIRRYDAESIVNWRVEIQKGKPVLTMIVLREVVCEPDASNPFKDREIEQYRVLNLGAPEEGLSPRYYIDLWRRPERPSSTDQWEIVSRIVPTRRGEPLTAIPFICIGASDLTMDIEKSPILPLAETNLSHYRTSADLEHGAHFTALPTLWLSGGPPNDGGDMKVGSGVAWRLDSGESAGILEFHGQGLGALETRLASKEKHMAVLGARLLEDQPAQAETAAAVKMRHRGENSILASIAQTASRGLTMALGWCAWWTFASEDPAASTITLNSDFESASLSAADVVKLVEGWQKGGYGGRVLHHALSVGEMLPNGMSYDDWQQDIEEAGAATLNLVPRSAVE